VGSSTRADFVGIVETVPSEPVPPAFNPRPVADTQIIGEKANRIYFLNACDVEYVASAGNYVVVHLGAHEYLTRATLKGLSGQLAPVGFVQIERSLLVNLRQVAHVERLDRGQYCFVMRSGARLVSSRERHASIRAMLLGATTPLRS